ncbi:MAG: replication factor A [Methanosarcinales archaeon]|uniref:Replication factor A n=1 Tax=Candidatus Ethanoperedens thermophilum TaxID=2766897 RepID=A0A848D6I5_9EURY|nr:replication factor A [Candidatus Ethanoperedens thermophilum]
MQCCNTTIKVITLPSILFCLMSVIEDYFKKVQSQLSFDDFFKRVEEKREVMAGLCDDDTLCRMVLQELGVDSIKKISEITVDSGNVSIKAKILSVSEVRDFSRDNGTTGQVSNLTIGDETGNIRTVLWDDAADLVKTKEIQKDSNLNITGTVRDGQNGLEIHVGRGGRIDILDQDISAHVNKCQVADIGEGMVSVNLTAKIIDAGNLRFFTRRDGGEGKVRTVTLGDQTGKINLTLWDESAEMMLVEDEVIEITNAYSKKNNYTNNIELQLSRDGLINKTEAHVDYDEKITPIGDIELDNTYSIQGFVSGIGEIREFTRRDGKTGQVANAHISDDTGRVKATLWGDQANIIDEIDIGSEVMITSAMAKTGLNEEIELNLDWNSKVKILRK